ncbi:MAG TPA: hypothetical protein VJC16_02115 [Candidatus Nanoarchaeia archaeon]|nr:hypothetical protein [Candidatus Nanoarchaeia archaeon]
MKKMDIAGISLFLLLIPLAYSADVSSSGVAALNITLISQVPDPVEPGDIVELRWKIDNKAAETAENVLFEIVENYPFTIYEGSATQSLGTIYGRQKGKSGVIAHFKVKVDPGAVTGDNKIAIRYKYGGVVGLDWVEPEPFVVRVRPREAVLSVADITADRIPPGGTGRVRITLKNQVAAGLEYVRARLLLDDVPLVPVGSSNERSIREIPAYENATLVFLLAAEGDAAAQHYKVPLQLDYFDQVKNYSASLVVGVLVGAVPEMYAAIDSSEIIYPGTTGRVVIRFVNKGSGDIKFLNVRMQENSDVRAISPPEAYVGTIDSDDYDTAEFTLYVKGEEQVTLPLVAEYRDSNNELYRQQLDLPLRLYSRSEAKRYGLAQGSSGVGVLIVLAIVAAGVYFFIRRRRKKKS